MKAGINIYVIEKNQIIRLSASAGTSANLQAYVFTFIKKSHVEQLAMYRA